MLALVFVGVALIPVVLVAWVLVWLLADAVAGATRAEPLPIRVMATRNRRWL